MEVNYQYPKLYKGTYAPYMSQSVGKRQNTQTKDLRKITHRKRGTDSCFFNPMQALLVFSATILIPGIIKKLLTKFSEKVMVW